jgi:hypothetical protein
MDGPAPAILNAIEEATGVRFNHCPLLPEDIFDMLANPTSISADSSQLQPAVAGPVFSGTTS